MTQPNHHGSSFGSDLTKTASASANMLLSKTGYPTPPLSTVTTQTERDPEAVPDAGLRSLDHCTCDGYFFCGREGSIGGTGVDGGLGAGGADFAKMTPRDCIGVWKQDDGMVDRNTC